MDLLDESTQTKEEDSKNSNPTGLKNFLHSLLPRPNTLDSNPTPTQSSKKDPKKSSVFECNYLHSLTNIVLILKT